MLSSQILNCVLLVSIDPAGQKKKEATGPSICDYTRIRTGLVTAITGFLFRCGLSFSWHETFLLKGPAGEVRRGDRSHALIGKIIAKISEIWREYPSRGKAKHLVPF